MKPELKSDSSGAPCPDRAAGRLVALVGPDGVGKSTVAEALVTAWPGPTCYVHFRPPLTGALPAGPPAVPGQAPDKGPRRGNRPLGWLRIGRSLLLFWLGYLLTVRPAVRRGALVVADRWAFGYVGQPHALRFYGPARLGRLVVRLMPQPDLVVNLDAPDDVILQRKQELDEKELSVERVRWRALPTRALRTYQTTAQPEELARRVLADLHEQSSP